MSDITFEFATHDDCLDKMVPSDLRVLVAERDRLIERNRELEALIDPGRYRQKRLKMI